ncbi:P-loop containing nucleoside triphosphate hydrolase protein [Ascodesmis nigricans]|uniref:P-loop containing nucleoside triphosphate hydrolase protein n=1 Tax=Ascodesmis nigricans TaxID=341454 RepID=A0A4S2MP81_9PEZI|nr:P-loop containing nucleoside triphosphate hydrolase protein [Ascodesmis nigricans]
MADEKRQALPGSDDEDGSRASNTNSSSSSRHEDVEKGLGAPVPATHTSRWKEIRTTRTWNPLRWQRAPPIPEERKVSGEATAGILSQLTFSWMTSLMTTGYLRQLETTDIPLVAPKRQAEVITEKLQESFTRRKERGDKYPLLWAMHEVVFWEFWVGGACRLVADILMVVNPFLLRFLIQFAVDSYNASEGETEKPAIGRGVGFAFGIAAIQGVTSLCVSQFIYRSMIVGGQLRAGLISMIFDKSLKISARAKAGGMIKEQGEDDEVNNKGDEKNGKKGKKKDKKREGEGGAWSNGRVVNLMGTDTYRVDQAMSWFHLIWTSPVMIILTLVVLIINISYSALAGFALLLIAVPVLSWVVKVLAQKRRKMNLITDTRVALMQEILNGVKFVKFFGWEESFMHRLQELRTKEIGAIQFLLGIRSGVNAVGLSLPIFASMLAFITYSLTDNSLEPSTIFSSLALFNALRMPMNLLPMVIAQVIDAWVSLTRIQEYFFAEEITDNITHDPNSDAAICVTDGSFTWETTLQEQTEDKTKKSKKSAEEPNNPAPVAPDQTPFTLKDINLSVGRNELLAVVGSVGSGKTSLLAAMAGDMRRTSGNVTIAAQLAYCPQYAWIQNATFRDNIIFGKPYDREWYQTVVEACALQRDIDMLPDGDKTEIGERGITVSGGQKQRLNIARAIYFNADIVLMDDPLSAVDAHVGKHLFDKAICGLLAGKCRVLATHQLHVLQKVDRVVWMENGRIQAVGTFPELMEGNPGFANMMREISMRVDKEETKEEKEKEEVEEIEEEKEEIAALKRQKTAASAKQLMTAEEKPTDSVGWKVYKTYIQASGSMAVAPVLLFFLLAAQIGNIMATMWLSYWTSGKYNLSQGAYIGGFAGLAVAQGVFLFAFAFGLTIAGTRSSKKLMAQAMNSTLRAPMSFFDTTPIGRIVNRFSKDVDVMDNQLTDAIRMYFLTLTIITSVIILIIVYFHWFAIAIVPLAGVFIFAASYYRASAREVKRHEALLRSHVFARFGEALTGTASIRAYGLEDRFRATISKAINDMNGAYFITFANQRWLSLRLDIIGISLVFTTCILVVTSRFSVHPSIAGVVLSYILQIVMMLQWMIRQLAEVENSMNSTERIYFYGHGLPSEPPLKTNVQLRPTWPEQGTVVFTDASMCYRPGLPLVLKNLNLTIPGGSRVGIVGRTGAGKSSITSVLFRLVELSSGSISIDGVDISALGLHDLRNKLAIIPQDPTLFKGTIRSNLDPFNQYPEETLVSALEASYLDSAITLDSPVDEEGLNYSLGQRQQLALARALVRGARVVVADEATSSIDVETDGLIQKSMKEGFKGRTLLCVAHRLRTIVGYDKVVVMEAGEIVEYGRPKELWLNQEGVFRGMCDKGGISEADFEDERR